MSWRDSRSMKWIQSPKKRIQFGEVQISVAKWIIERDDWNRIRRSSFIESYIELIFFEIEEYDERIPFPISGYCIVKRVYISSHSITRKRRLCQMINWKRASLIYSTDKIFEGSKIFDIVFSLEMISWRLSSIRILCFEKRWFCVVIVLV